MHIKWKGKALYLQFYKENLSQLPGSLSIFINKPKNPLSSLKVFNHFVGLELKGLIIWNSSNFCAQPHVVAFLIYALGLPNELLWDQLIWLFQKLFYWFKKATDCLAGIYFCQIWVWQSVVNIHFREYT